MRKHIIILIILVFCLLSLPFLAQTGPPVTVPNLGRVTTASGNDLAINQQASGAPGTTKIITWNNLLYSFGVDTSSNNSRYPKKTTTISTTAPLTGGGDLSTNRTIAIAAATTSVNGYLTATDWNTFNGKEPAITAGTTAQYWRGDKTWQTLPVLAITALTGDWKAGNYSINLGNASTTGQKLMRLGQGTSFIDFGEVANGQFGMWANNTSPTSSNYWMGFSGSQMILNPNGSLSVRINNSTCININFTTQTFGPQPTNSGAITPFTFNTPANTGQTASTEINGEYHNSGSRQWLTGNITTQREHYITAPTYSFVGASTITTAATLSVDPPVAGTNCTITTGYAIHTTGLIYGGFVGNGLNNNFGNGTHTFGGRVQIFNAGIKLATAGTLIEVQSGTNQRAGEATLVAGTVTISNTTVTANTRMQITRHTTGGTAGNTTYTTIASTSFTINSDNPLDTSTYSYFMYEVN
jgi:hypothetical protein